MERLSSWSSVWMNDVQWVPDPSCLTTGTRVRMFHSANILSALPLSLPPRLFLFMSYTFIFFIHISKINLFIEKNLCRFPFKVGPLSLLQNRVVLLIFLKDVSNKFKAANLCAIGWSLTRWWRKLRLSEGLLSEGIKADSCLNFERQLKGKSPNGRAFVQILSKPY